MSDGDTLTLDSVGILIFYLGKPLKINFYKASFVEIPMTQLRGSKGSKYCRLD